MSDGEISGGETAHEIRIRDHLCENRRLKRSKDRTDSPQQKIIHINDDDEHFSIQPAKKHPRIEAPKPLADASTERNHHRDHGQHKSSRHDVSDEPVKDVIDTKKISSTIDSDPDRGLSSSPDSFADAAVSPKDVEEPKDDAVASNATTPIPDDDRTITPVPVAKAHSTVDTTESSDNPPLRPIDDDDIREILLDDLTDAQKAALSPEQLRRLDERTQQHYISCLPKYYPGLRGCRSVSEYNCLNKIDEGTFGIVYRAQEKRTGVIYALKRLKLERERDGFPVTSLREVNLLLMCRDHPNVVNVKEIVVGNHMDKVYLVMEYVEHDLKALVDQLSERGQKFTTAQIKTLTRQLLSGLEFMHHNWMIHRDLKTSNLLLSHKGVLKIGDFGLARTYGQPLKPFTPVVVTLWYRSPELLLETKMYSTAVDMWSVGCIMAEFFKLKPLFRGNGEVDQINKIFYQLGSPSPTAWPEYSSLPMVKKVTFKEYPYNQLRKQFGSDVISESGLALLNGFFIYNPNKRLTASQALESPWFEEHPLPMPPELFPTWPARSERGKVPPPSRAPPPEPEIVIELDDSTKKLYEQLNIDPRKIKKSNGPYVPRYC